MKATEKLEGAELDRAVAEKFGWLYGHESRPDWWYTVESDGTLYMRVHNDGWTPSTNPTQGMPIIEKHGIELIKLQPPDMQGNKWTARMEHIKPRRGPTPLIAAMRAFVASKQ
jgi:hypothetical protein